MMLNTGNTSNINDPIYRPYQPAPAPCPCCGHCPTCGRGGHHSAPYWVAPVWPWYSTAPSIAGGAMGAGGAGGTYCGGPR